MALSNQKNSVAKSFQCGVVHCYNSYAFKFKSGSLPTPFQEMYLRLIELSRFIYGKKRHVLL